MWVEYPNRFMFSEDYSCRSTGGVLGYIFKTKTAAKYEAVVHRAENTPACYYLFQVGEFATQAEAEAAIEAEANK